MDKFLGYYSIYYNIYTIMDYSFIYLIHILFAGPLLIYGGYVGKNLSEKCEEEKHISVFISLIAVGILVILYHLHKFLRMKGFIN